MILKLKSKNNIFLDGENRIAFTLNPDCSISEGFAGLVCSKYWPELANIKNPKLGTIFKHKSEGIMFYAMFCETEKWWRNQEHLVIKCLNSIAIKDKPLACVSDAISEHKGPELSSIQRGMSHSEHRIVLYK